MVNIDNIRATVDLIDKEANSHRQFNMSTWGQSNGSYREDPEICGTQMCFAGWAVVASGGRLKTYTEEHGGETLYGTVFVDAHDRQVDACEHAKEWLGLPNRKIFFNTDVNDVHELRVALKELYGVDA